MHQEETGNLARFELRKDYQKLKVDCHDTKEV